MTFINILRFMKKYFCNFIPYIQKVRLRMGSKSNCKVSFNTVFTFPLIGWCCMLSTPIYFLFIYVHLSRTVFKKNKKAMLEYPTVFLNKLSDIFLKKIVKVQPANSFTVAFKSYTYNADNEQNEYLQSALFRYSKFNFLLNSTPVLS